MGYRFCGPGKWAINDSVFNLACRRHDDGYEAGVYPREMLDSWFLIGMLAAARKRGGSRWDYARAYAYYGLVRAFGWLAYDRKRSSDHHGDDA